MKQYLNIRGGGRIQPAPFTIFGIVNATPDSFSDGAGRITSRMAISRARRAWKQGAQVLDIGGESTRPYAPAVSPEEECARILPVIEAALRFQPRETGPAGQTAPGQNPGQTIGVSGLSAGLSAALSADNVPLLSPVISIDTRNATVAAAALEAGAHIINDVSGCADPAMPELLAQYRPGYVLMHTQGAPENMQDNPRYADPMADLLHFFEQAMQRLTRAGLPEEHILLDPGIGFGKRLEHNLAILRNLRRFESLGRPLLLGISKKSLFGDLLGLPVNKRGPATQTLTALAAQQGVLYHRVHDVAGAAQALTLALTLAIQAEH